MRAHSLLSNAELTNMQRLRWLVLSRFGVLPGSPAALLLTDRQCIRCGINMVLDRQRTASGTGAAVNFSFDESRFQTLKEGGRR